MRWLEVGRGYWRSDCGRFEVMAVTAENVVMYVVAYDYEVVRRKVYQDTPLPVAAARRWCELRARQAKVA